jgi:signal peptidase I
VANKPKKWIAALLAVIALPIGMVYVGQIGWAGIYLVLALAIGAVGELYLNTLPIVFGAMQILLVLTCGVHAYRLAVRYPDDKPRPGYSRWYGLLAALCGLALVAYGVRAFLVEPFRSPSGAMLPTIPIGAHLIVQKWGYGNYGSYGLVVLRTSISSPLNRGDIIVFEVPSDRSTNYVKRLIGLPGDKIDYHGKRLVINGKPVSLRQAGNYVDPTSRTSTPRLVESLPSVEYSVIVTDDSPANVSKTTNFLFRDKCVYDSQGVTCDVPAGHYFTMGDNRDNSYDSRMWGFVPADHIVGKVLYILH